MNETRRDTASNSKIFIQNEILKRIRLDHILWLLLIIYACIHYNL